MSFKRLSAGLAVLLTLCSFSGVAHAQQQGGSGLSISPTRTELTINPGKAGTIEISLKNISGINITAKAVVNDFESDDDSGEPKVIIDSKKPLPTSIAKFLIGVEDVPLKKDETKKLVIPVQIPANAVSGAYYGVIRYTAEAVNKQEAEGRQVALNASIGHIVLIQIPGNITEQVQARKITVSKNDSNSIIFVSAPDTVNITLKNTGNGFTKPYGRVKVSKGGKEVFAYEMNNTDPRSNILPNGSRTFKDAIKSVGKMGRYNVEANISYGKGGDILTMRTSFWVLPVWFLVLLGVLFVILIFGGFFTYRKLGGKKGKRRF